MGLMRLPKFHCYEPGGVGGIGGVGTSGPSSSAGTGGGGSEHEGSSSNWGGWIGGGLGFLAGAPFNVAPATALAGYHIGKNWDSVRDFLGGLSSGDTKSLVNDFESSGGGDREDFVNFVEDQIKDDLKKEKQRLWKEGINNQALGDISQTGFGDQAPQPTQNMYGPPAASPFNFSVFGGGK